MIYFIGHNLETANTGVEKAQINRLKLFNKYQIPAKIIYLVYNTGYNHAARIHGVNRNFLSMYEYLQDAVHVNTEVKQNWIEHWEGMGYRLELLHATQDMRIYNGDRQLMLAHFWDKNYERVRYINYFDNTKRKVKRELYDARGFLSCTCHLYNNRIMNEIYYSPRGEVKIEKYYRHENDRRFIGQIIVHDSYNRSLHFNLEKELIAYFLEKLYRPEDQFIIDRPLEAALPIISTAYQIPAYIFLHTTHALTNTNKFEGHIKPTFRYPFEYPERYKGFIVSTYQQREDLIKLLKDKVPVYDIPVGYVDDTSIERLQKIVKVPVQKDKLKIVSFGRYCASKKLHHQIHLVNRLKEEFPNIELQMFGYGPLTQELKQLVKDLKLEKYVYINDFTLDVAKECETAVLSLSTSHMEGFSLAIMDALSNGVPVIAYDIDYGPASLIHHKENGELISLNNQEELYQSVKSYLSDPLKQQRYRDNCLTYIRNFSEDKNIRLWRNILGLI